jgi:hypothetical protein
MFGSGAQSFTDSNRIPMAFTSTKRLRLVNPNFQSITSLLTGNINAQEASLAETFFGTQKSIYGATINGVNGEMSVIEMMVNPNSITWKQPKRIVKRDTQEGSIFFHFSNSRGQNNDILTMDFKGNTGNINVRSDIDSDEGSLSTIRSINTGATKKLLIWHNLWQLTREQMLLDDGTMNEFMIFYTSPVIPGGITLIGFFSTTLDWTDSADKPNSKDYAFSFTVQETVPPLDDLLQDINTVVVDPQSVVPDIIIK